MKLRFTNRSCEEAWRDPDRQGKARQGKARVQLRMGHDMVNPYRLSGVSQSFAWAPMLPTVPWWSALARMLTLR